MAKSLLYGDNRKEWQKHESFAWYTNPEIICYILMTVQAVLFIGALVTMSPFWTGVMMYLCLFLLVPEIMFYFTDTIPSKWERVWEERWLDKLPDDNEDIILYKPMKGIE